MRTARAIYRKSVSPSACLYGSPYIMMDEPVFALEHIWKERVLEYLKDYTRKHNETAVYFSLHELDLSRKYSDNALLFQ